MILNSGGTSLACIGQISKSQIDRLKADFSDCEIITMFDDDDAGKKYQETMAKAGFRHLRQLLPPEGYKDPDEALKKGGMSLDELLSSARVYGGSVDEPALDSQSGPIDVLLGQGLIELDFDWRSDQSNADMLCALTAGCLKYIPEHNDWAFFDGVRWQFRQHHKVYEFARLVGEVRRTWALQMPDKADYQKKAKQQAMSYASKCHDQARINSMITLASKSIKVIASAADFDSDPYLLGVKNGVVDLRTGKLVPAEKELLISKQCQAAYLPDAVTPARWQVFLSRVFDDLGEEHCLGMIQYLQRIFGMSLIGRVLVRELYFIYGKPASGKSLLTNTLKRILGDYALELSPNSLMLSSYQSNDIKMPEIVQLKGVRFALAMEAEDGQRFNEALLKRITGNDFIKARDIFEKGVSFRPQCTLFLTGNSRPAANGSPAFWDRLRVIRMDRSVPKAEQDVELESKLIEESDCILTWLIQGCLAFQAQGVQEPARVAADSAAYRADLDTLTQFLDENCELDATACASTHELYEVYARWATGMGIGALGQNRLNERFIEAGFSKTKARLNGSPNPIHAFKGLRITRHPL